MSENVLSINKVFALRFKQELQEEVNRAVDHMVSGGCKNFEEYRYVVGKIESLKYAGNEFIRLHKLATGEDMTDD